MTDKAVLVERRGHVLLATLNRPQVRNAVNAELSALLGDALEQADQDTGIRCVVVTGAGDKAFCAGADLKELAGGGGIGVRQRPEWGFAGFVNHAMSKPIIAAVNGFALGGGTEIALASDIVVAARSASFGLPEVKRGVLAGAGGLIRLPRQLPSKIAMQLILTGDSLSAEEALRWGLVNQVTDDGAVLDAALSLADRICANSPLAVQASKRIARGMLDGRYLTEDGHWEINSSEIQSLMASNDRKEGVRAFAEKREPVWTGT